MTTPALTTAVRFTSPLSRQVEGSASGDIVDDINAYFLANPNIEVRDASIYARGYDETSYGLVITLLVQRNGDVTGQTMTPAGASYVAEYLAGGLGVIDVQTSALLGDEDTYRGFALPLSGIRPGRAAETDWVLIYADSTLGPAPLKVQGMGQLTEPAIAAPTAPIAAGATGDCTLVNARGVVIPGTFRVRNLGGASWATGIRSLAYWDVSFGGLVGLPLDAAVSSPLTTTTSTGPI